MELLQLVSVSCRNSKRHLTNSSNCFLIVITCEPPSSIHNGVITYSPDRNAYDSFIFGTIANYSCNRGFFLEGESTRFCNGSGSSVKGVWNGTAPVCSGELF